MGNMLANIYLHIEQMQSNISIQLLFFYQPDISLSYSILAVILVLFMS